MKVLELYKKIDELIPHSLSCDWDNDGLMCCSAPNKEVKRVLLTLDVTEAAVNFAVENKFDVIISHHPLIFRPISSVVSPKLINLIKNDITVISLHTRLDKINGGVNTVLAESLDLKDFKTFSDDGIGLIGEIDSKLSLNEFAERVKSVTSAPFLEVVSADIPCHRIALVGGDGKDSLNYAFKAGCDTYLTGSMSYNTLTDASELGINVICAGHFYTENLVLDKLSEMLVKIDSTILCKHFISNLIEVF